MTTQTPDPLAPVKDALQHVADDVQLLAQAIQDAIHSVLIYAPPAFPFNIIVADNTGKTEATADFQLALDQGGLWLVGPGIYLINAVTMVRVRSNTTLILHPDAILQAMPTDAAAYAVLLVELVRNVHIEGGQIRGERLQHLGPPPIKGTNNEHGHCIQVSGSERVTIKNTRLSDGWGDGLNVGPSHDGTQTPSRDVTLDNVTCNRNRRNGLTVGNVITLRAYNCEFSDTGDVHDAAGALVQEGTSPKCGIDAEPNNVPTGGYCDDVLIDNCLITRNTTYGVNLFGGVRNFTITRCTVEQNVSCGIVGNGIQSGALVSNTIRQNGSTGVFIQGASANINIAGNQFALNYSKQSPTLRATPLVATGLVAATRRDLLVGTGPLNITVGSNAYQ